ELRESPALLIDLPRCVQMGSEPFYKSKGSDPTTPAVKGLRPRDHRDAAGQGRESRASRRRRAGDPNPATSCSAAVEDRREHAGERAAVRRVRAPCDESVRPDEYGAGRREAVRIEKPAVDVDEAVS